MRLMCSAQAALAAAAILGTTGTASAAAILPGIYRLHNHPDGNSNPPPYGARFDELFNATTGHDVFTLDFDHIQSQVIMTINANLTQIHIQGQAFGGRDVGSVYANDAFEGVYQLDFTYSIGVSGVPGDDDLWVNGPDNVNFGTITGPGGQVVALSDKSDGNYAFRLGDEDNDAGHRGFNGISGWGWMQYVQPTGSPVHVASTDWLFTATYQIPAPGAGGLALTAGFVLARRRRR